MDLDHRFNVYNWDRINCGQKVIYLQRDYATTYITARIPLRSCGCEWISEKYRRRRSAWSNIPPVKGNKHEKWVVLSSDIQTPRRNTPNTRRTVSSDIQTTRFSISGTRRSVLWDIQTPRCNIASTRRSVSSDIKTPRSNMLKTNRGVFHPIFRHLEVINKTRGECFIWYPIPRSNILSTKRSVSISLRHWEVGCKNEG